MRLYVNETSPFLDCLLSSLRKGAILWLVLKFSKLFFKEKPIYDYVSLPVQRYDFISETITPGNVTKTKRAKSADYRTPTSGTPS